MLVISFHDAVLRKAQGLVDIMRRTRDRARRRGGKKGARKMARGENFAPALAFPTLVPAVCCCVWIRILKLTDATEEGGIRRGRDGGEGGEITNHEYSIVSLWDKVAGVSA